MIVTTEKTPLAKFMEQLLEERNVSIRALALYMNVSDRTIRRMLEGDTPDPETLKKLADYANYPVENLFRMVGWLPEESTKTAVLREIERLLDDVSEGTQKKIRDQIRVEWEYERGSRDEDQTDETPKARKAS